MSLRTVRRSLQLGIAVALLTGCGGDDGADPAQAGPAPLPSPSPSPPPPGSNAAPTITGAPPTTTLQGRVYSFRPTAADANRDSLTFSISNRPSWASFNTSTGRLMGTPSAIGAFSNVTITVSDGRASASLAPFNLNVTAVASGSAALSWMPPTQNTDGTPLSDLAGYRIHFGTQTGDYANSVTVANPGLATYVVDQLTPATWFFVVTALNDAGVESSFSNPASKSIQ